MITARLLLGALLLASVWSSAIAQTPQPQFGGKYAELDERRQKLVDGWVVRLEKTTGQKIEPASLYDDIVSLSSKTTFVAVTHALMTTRLTDKAGAELGDALTLVERIDVVRGTLELLRPRQLVEAVNRQTDKDAKLMIAPLPGHFSPDDIDPVQ